MRHGHVLFAGMILLAGSFFVKPVSAAESSIHLALDAGFLGRPVSLELFGGAFSLAWDGNTLAGPTEADIHMETDAEGAPVVTVAFADASALTPGASFTVGVKSALEHPALHVISGTGETDYAGTLVAGRTSSKIPADASFSVHPVLSGAPPVELSGAVSPILKTGDSVTLALDAGFVGRPVKLDLFGSDVTISWDERTLVAPATLVVTRVSGGLGEDQEEAAHAYLWEFDRPASVSLNGTFTVTHRALRPPTSGEQVEANIIGAEAETINAVFVGTSVSYRTAGASRVSAVPAFRSGIMRTGMASWYRYKDCDCAASPDVPKGTKLKVSRCDDPSRSVVVTVNDWGPDRSVFPDRVIDLDRRAFEKIGNPRGGVLAVNVELWNGE